MHWGYWALLCVALLIGGYVKRSYLYSWLYFIGYHIYVSKRIGYPKHLKLIDPKIAKVPHSHVTPHVSADGAATILPIPMLEDNYAYLIICNRTKLCGVVDPSDPYVVQSAIDSYKPSGAASSGVDEKDRLALTLSHVLTTHRHWDHAGGNKILKERNPTIEVVGGAIDAVDACTRAVRARDTIKIGELTVAVIETPCHTTGHVLYRLAEQNVLFTGDCLFTGGCGRFFEGNARQMYANFAQFRRLPASTLIFPGHEYAVSNLRYAEFVDPDTHAVTQKLAAARALRAAVGGARATIPSTLAEEYTYNPFLRCGELSIRRRLTAIKQCQLSPEVLLAGSGSGSPLAAVAGDSKKQDSESLIGGKVADEELSIRVLGELRRLRNADVHLPAGASDDE